MTRHPQEEPLLPVPATVEGFTHRHGAHCESGVTSALLGLAGLPLSEPMAFGVGAAVFFAYMPFVRVMGHPLSTFRTFPGQLFKTACKRLGVTVARETFGDPDAGMRRLDALLDQGRPVGLQVNIFWLPYIPRQIRIHFNAHNLLVVEKRDDAYVVSDPVVDSLFECPARDLRRARFTGGNRLLGRGLIHYPRHVPAEPDLRRAVQRGLADVSNRMLRIPRLVPWFGLNGIAHLARDISRWPARRGEEQARVWLASIVRMQEEIGTGGAGFRYMFAAFLQEAGERLAWADLAALSPVVTEVGDRWRAWALHASRMARGRPDLDWEQLALLLGEVGRAERELFVAVDRAARRS